MTPTSDETERGAGATTDATTAEAVRARGVAVAVVVGFLALAAGVAVAHRTPASGYEVSMYAATPLAFWVGVSTALGVAVVGTAVASAAFERRASLFLGSLAVAAFAALPLLRSYRFHGRYDSLTHLGWVKGLASGALNPFELLYPAAHTVAVALATLGGLPLDRAMLFVVWFSALVFVLFVPLCAHLLADDRRALAVGGVSAFLLLPINTISTYLHFHPYSMTTLFFPFFLFLLLAHLTRRYEDETLPGSLSATSVALPLVGVGVVLLHPQVALNVVLLVGVVAATQVVESRFLDSPAETRRVYAQFAVLSLVFTVWILQFDAAFEVLRRLTDLLASLLFGSAAGGVVQHQANSAQQYGLSLLALFVKLFLVGVVYSLLAAALVGVRAWSYVPFTGGGPDRGETVLYLGVSGAVLSVFFAAHLVGELSTYFFRHLGFAMVLATVVGTAALVRLSRRVETRVATLDTGRVRTGARGTLRAVGVVLAAAVLVVSLVSVFPSPYLYQPSQHVTDAQMTGYDTVFDHRIEGAGVAGISSGPGRFSDALHERLDPRLSWGIGASDLAGRLTTYTQGDYFTRSFYYLAVTEADYEREVVAYRGLQISEARLDSISGRPAVSRVYSNGGVRVYYVEQPSSVLVASDRVDYDPERRVNAS
ncbi:hypothetical protein [Halospeciosus flavus]|uniref:Uncharacterized protein n=1 Tax=Halospeciosus flavus TaxID=3032283 RepID=A0ABD5Z1I5_9EURY|nr:hypothetical protein [Halospeciosus flavus]